MTMYENRAEEKFKHYSCKRIRSVNSGIQTKAPLSKCYSKQTVWLALQTFTIMDDVNIKPSYFWQRMASHILSRLSPDSLRSPTLLDQATAPSSTVERYCSASAILLEALVLKVKRQMVKLEPPAVPFPLSEINEY